MTGHDESNFEQKSAKASKRQMRKNAKEERQYKRNPKPVEARSASQKLYIKSIWDNELTFGVGPAGVGKTYIPSRVFGEMLVRGDINKLYLARPNVAKAKHRMGFLPGGPDEKTAPWLVPVMEGLKDSMSPSEYAQMMKDGRIEIVPYEFLQGRTFKDAAFIVDEAENLDLDDLYITLTRQGENLKAVISGDTKQARINNSGLARTVMMAEHESMESIGVVRFGEDEVVRSRQARQWVKAFNRIDLNSSADCDTQNGTFTHPPEFLTRDT